MMTIMEEKEVDPWACLAYVSAPDASVPPFPSHEILRIFLPSYSEGVKIASRHLYRLQSHQFSSKHAMERKILSTADICDGRTSSNLLQ
jgi:hypothetical protein